MAIEIKELNLEQLEDKYTDTSGLPSHYYFYLLSFIGSIILMLLQPSQAKEVANAHGWFSQPYIAPFVGLCVIAFFSGTYTLFYAVRCFKCLRVINPIELVFKVISMYRTAVIISGFFILYISSLSIIGFALSSFILIISMLWVSNLFTRFWVTTSLLSVVAIILIFRVAVNLWLPDVWLYSLFPEEIAEFANMYL